MFANKESLHFIGQSKKRALDISMITLIKADGHSYAKPGNIMIMNSQEQSIGILGGAALQKQLSSLAQKSLSTSEILTYESIPNEKDIFHGAVHFLIEPFYHDENYGMLGECLQNFGKTLMRSFKDQSYEFIDTQDEKQSGDELFYQKIQRPYSVLVFGTGANTNALISLANFMGWSTTIIDMGSKNRSELSADNFITLERLDDIMSMDLRDYDASVILSHSDVTDDTYLQALLNSSVEYIGILGNKDRMRKKLEEFGISEDERVFAPVGFPIGGRSHQSIALSISAQIEARKNKKT